MTHPDLEREIATYNCYGLPITMRVCGKRVEWRYSGGDHWRSWSVGITEPARTPQQYAMSTREKMMKSGDEFGEWAFIVEQLVADGEL